MAPEIAAFWEGVEPISCDLAAPGKLSARYVSDVIPTVFCEACLSIFPVSKPGMC